jgi:hypothetical protein
MMSPRRLALVTALAVLAPPSLAVGDGRSSPRAGATAKEPVKARTATKKRATATKKRATATKKEVTRAKAKRGTRRVATRRKVRAVAGNMPPGWAWPRTPEMKAAGLACTTKLTELGVDWRPADAVERIATPITVPSMTFGAVKLRSWFRKPPFVMDCHLALALARHAEALHELGVRELKFSRIYGYTLVRAHGVTSNALSRHALGLAVDVRAVTDADGREALVERDYPQGDPLLRQVEAYLNDADGFRTVLTPKNDPVSHHDHFHLEVKVEYGP